MKVCVLGSGSDGNATYIEAGGEAILIDQGFTHKKFMERMESRSLDPERIRAILLTHEHSDHMKGARVTARKLSIPVYGTQGTLTKNPDTLKDVDEVIPIAGDTGFTVASFEVQPFMVSHDAAEPVQYRIMSGKRRMTIATDLGFVSKLVETRLRDSELIIIEANHDLAMLKNGSYSWPLKQRIMSKQGHLSNTNAAETLFNLAQKNSPITILAHLSMENNTAELARNEVNELFERYDHTPLKLTVALQDTATELIEL